MSKEHASLMHSLKQKFTFVNDTNLINDDHFTVFSEIVGSGNTRRMSRVEEKHIIKANGKQRCVITAKHSLLPRSILGRDRNPNTGSNSGIKETIISPTYLFIFLLKDVVIIETILLDERTFRSVFVYRSG